VRVGRDWRSRWVTTVERPGTLPYVAARLGSARRTRSLPVRVLHLSDCHLPREPGPDTDGVDARAVLDQLLHDCRHLPGIDLVVLSGDVADDGSAEGYRDARALVGGFARERGVPALFCTGNHDDRAAFAESLGSGHLDPDGRDMGRLLPGASGLRAAVSHTGGYRVVTLDSLVPGEVHGRVDRAQLVWLREVLAAPYGRGSVVVLHHPPIALPGTVQERVGLRDPDELAAALDGTDVRVVLCGHYHLQLSGRLGVVPVWVTAGVVTRIDLTAPAGLERAVRGAGASLVELDGPRAPLCHTVHARDPRAGEQVYLVDLVSGADVPDESPRASAPQPALPVDAEGLLALREAAAAWLAARGVRQWEPGEVDLDEVRRQVAAGEWHVLRDGDGPVAALRLLWHDEQVWGPQPPVAGYVHGLVVAERRRGCGTGAALLRWAAGQARARGRSLLRLDCGEDNDALRRYYAQQGFRPAGRRDANGRWYSVVLLERPI